MINRAKLQLCMMKTQICQLSRLKLSIQRVDMATKYLNVDSEYPSKTGVKDKLVFCGSFTCMLFLSCSCFCYGFVCVCLLIAGKGLTSWLSFVKSYCEVVT